jgi:hypothetical protein
MLVIAWCTSRPRLSQVSWDSCDGECSRRTGILPTHRLLRMPDSPETSPKRRQGEAQTASSDDQEGGEIGATIQKRVHAESEPEAGQAALNPKDSCSGLFVVSRYTNHDRQW